MTLVRVIVFAAKSPVIINHLQRQVERFRVISWRNFGVISPGIFTMKFFVLFSFERNFTAKNDD